MEGALFEKLTILSEGAKYDVSCSSSGADRTNVGRIGSAACSGICHSWAADGRCISLLKVLLSNDCVYDCRYCVNRAGNDVPRATFEPEELAGLTMEFYRRNYIEGLFISSAVTVSPDYTMERMYQALRILREECGFVGYIHAKVIPGVSQELLYGLGLMSDRLSVNIETPSESSLHSLAPQKRPERIFGSMSQITVAQAEHKTLKAAGFMGKGGPSGYGFSGFGKAMDGQREKYGIGGMGAGFGIGASDASYGDGSLYEALNGCTPAASLSDSPRGISGGRSAALPAASGGYREKFAAAGQTTQMVIGASNDSDWQIVRTSEALYRKFSLKRVYFSAYIPVAGAPGLPALGAPPPLKREHRLYQADFLLRFYGFRADEILGPDQPDLDIDLDPKAIWALRHIELFPIEVNRATIEELMRIPGIGLISAKRIVRQRRMAAARYDDLKKMGVVVKRAKYFITCLGGYYGGTGLNPEGIRAALSERAANPQISMFDTQLTR